ncbi:MAG: hypothetical protein NTX72_04840 [Candidatus Uhrbacteria bacterium]|nr:hypothetical protein [Candidatus Uhrbacteria bacterium]
MTREDVAKKIHWRYVIGFMGMTNVVAILPQLIKVLETHQTKDLSLVMFSTILAIQIAFSADGFFTRNRTLFLSNACAACCNASLISLVMYFRSFNS